MAGTEGGAGSPAASGEGSATKEPLSGLVWRVTRQGGGWQPDGARGGRAQAKRTVLSALGDPVQLGDGDVYGHGR